MQEVLPYCQQFGVLEAQAYLLERLGDIPAALDIYVQQLEQAARALVDAVLSGRVPAAQLQAAGHPRASHSRLLGQRHPAPSDLDLPAEVKAPSVNAGVSRQCRSNAGFASVLSDTEQV